MTITTEEIQREKQRLPRGWGRFGKSLDRLAAISEPEESLLSSCVTLNPSFEHKTVTLAGGLYEMTKTTNVVLASTTARVIWSARASVAPPGTMCRSPTTASRWPLSQRRSSYCGGPTGRCVSVAPPSSRFPVSSSRWPPMPVPGGSAAEPER